MKQYLRDHADASSVTSSSPRRRRLIPSNPAPGTRPLLDTRSLGNDVQMGDDYLHLGNGPQATGDGPGWSMSGELYARCPRCRDFISLNPTETVQCTCGALHKDADVGRIGSSFRDDAIEVYRRA